MKGFDAHLILKGYERNVAQRGSQINVIPSNTEKFIAFQIGKLRFLDSLQFLNASLDSLVNTLPPDAFNLVSKFSPRPDLAKQKGVYPYNYMTDISKFHETQLPSKEMFYNMLNETYHGRGISESARCVGGFQLQNATEFSRRISHDRRIIARRRIRTL